MRAVKAKTNEFEIEKLLRSLQLNFMKIYTFAGAVPPKTKEKLKPHDFQFLYDGVLMKNLRSRNGLVINEQ